MAQQPSAGETAGAEVNFRLLENVLYQQHKNRLRDRHMHEQTGQSYLMDTKYSVAYDLNN